MTVQSWEIHLGGEAAFVFLGTHEPKLDDKGRLILPAKFREELAGGLVLTKGQERCLFMFTRQEFERMYAALQSAPLTSKEARDYIRMLLSGASDDIPDKQGRITIPPKLREYAGLQRELAVIGAGNRLEIWDLQAWNAYVENHEESYSQTTQEIIPGLF